MSRHPSTKWAQRSDKVYLTIELPDAKDVSLKLQPDGQFNFSAKSGDDNIPYELDLELYDAVNVDESKYAVSPRSICYVIKKDESKWWSRLMKKEGRPPVYLKVDWDKWVDEDEESGAPNDMDFGGMDFSKLGMGGMGGMGDFGGGMGGMGDFGDDLEDEDEDDDAVESAVKAGDEMAVDATASKAGAGSATATAEAAAGAEA